MLCMCRDNWRVPHPWVYRQLAALVLERNTAISDSMSSSLRLTRCARLCLRAAERRPTIESR